MKEADPSPSLQTHMKWRVLMVSSVKMLYFWPAPHLTMAPMFFMSPPRIRSAWHHSVMPFTITGSFTLPANSLASVATWDLVCRAMASALSPPEGTEPANDAIVVYMLSKCAEMSPHALFVIELAFPQLAQMLSKCPV
jgi:hypothetical protein